jgi:hypothetical protein
MSDVCTASHNSDSRCGQNRTRSRLLGLFLGDQSAVAVRIGTRLASAKFALLSRSGSARWTRDCKCFCEAEFLLHVVIMPRRTAAGMVNSEQVWQFILCRKVPALGDAFGGRTLPRCVGDSTHAWLLPCPPRWLLAQSVLAIPRARG